MKIVVSEPLFQFPLVYIPSTVLFSTLSPTAKTVYFALLATAHLGIPSYNVLSSRLHMTDDDVKSAIKELAAEEMVKISRGENQSRVIEILPLPARYRPCSSDGLPALGAFPTAMKQPTRPSSWVLVYFGAAFENATMRKYITVAGDVQAADHILEALKDEAKIKAAITSFLSNDWVIRHQPTLVYMARSLNGIAARNPTLQAVNDLWGKR